MRGYYVFGHFFAKKSLELAYLLLKVYGLFFDLGVLKVSSFLVKSIALRTMRG